MNAECGMGNPELKRTVTPGSFCLVPFMRIGESWTLSDDELGDLFDRMVEERKIKTVFYDGSITEKSQFREYFKNPSVMAIGAWGKDKNPIIWIWLTSIHSEAGFIHFCTFRGAGAREKIRATSAILEKLLGYFECLVGVTPEPFAPAVHFAALCGFKILGTIPRMLYLPYEQKRAGAVISYLGRSN